MLVPFAGTARDATSETGPATAWDAVTGGTQYTELVIPSLGVVDDEITPDGGIVPRFKVEVDLEAVPDPEVWLDWGSGDRVQASKAGDAQRTAYIEATTVHRHYGRWVGTSGSAITATVEYTLTKADIEGSTTVLLPPDGNEIAAALGTDGYFTLPAGEYQIWSYIPVTTDAPLPTGDTVQSFLCWDSGGTPVVLRDVSTESYAVRAVDPVGVLCNPLSPQGDGDDVETEFAADATFRVVFSAATRVRMMVSSTADATLGEAEIEIFHFA